MLSVQRSAPAEPAREPGEPRVPLLERFTGMRDRTVALCAPLSREDHVVQPMPDASPAKWHLAHTTWFFEAFVLDGARFDPAFEFLFNSYYEAVGPRVPRTRRGMLTRPGLDRIHAYRAAIDHRIARALGDGALDDAALARLELGLHHEQQHQELILTDAKYLLGTQPLAPAYRDLPRGAPAAPAPLGWRSEPGGIVEIGAPRAGFAFDNERPRHGVLLPPYRIASRPIANAEVLAFIAEGGYRDPRLWLSDGWQLAQAERWEAPLYWIARDGDHALYDLAGVRTVDPGETACHLSLYEADAIARWLGARLPTEAEWEHGAASAPLTGHFADTDRLHPERAPVTEGERASAGEGPRTALARGNPGGMTTPGRLAQLFGDVWEWTQSSYAAYPGFQPLGGALGEYNGKFMSGQYVLRGGSCLTPAGHIRPSYRNFFPASARWQMTGVRLAQDL
ncbi:MAG: ergothioneine biosynthesis protein EgtB [Deltaproteobacteria bacterium]|nr:MAG: ergothioneine biosynthesis protein EgtB [Deltaproteobacteria bacterium]